MIYFPHCDRNQGVDYTSTENIIIPNNRKIVEAFESNISVLSMEEVEVYKKFKIHAEAFESCNKGEIIREGTPRFPVEFEQMIKGEK